MKDIVHPLYFVFSLLILASGIGFAGIKIHDGLTNFRSYDRSVTVKGLATQDVTADTAIWPIAYTETGNTLGELQTLMDQRGAIIIQFFKEFGILETEIQLQQIDVQDLLAQAYRQGNVDQNRYIITQTYLVRTNNIEAISKASKSVGDLIKQGVVLAQNGASSPVYLYTKLNDIKPPMLALATQNAKEAAQEFSNQTGQKVGDIKQASQGIFQILPRDETYTIQESQQINKTVRVVSTIEFYLE